MVGGFIFKDGMVSCCGKSRGGANIIHQHQ